MTKTLSPIGNSLGLIIDRPILELLNITRETQLEIRTDGEALIVRPIRADHKTRVHDATVRMMNAHQETLEKLAK